MKTQSLQKLARVVRCLPQITVIASVLAFGLLMVVASVSPQPAHITWVAMATALVMFLGYTAIEAEPSPKRVNYVNGLRLLGTVWLSAIGLVAQAPALLFLFEHATGELLWVAMSFPAAFVVGRCLSHKLLPLYDGERRKAILRYLEAVLVAYRWQVPDAMPDNLQYEADRLKQDAASLPVDTLEKRIYALESALQAVVDKNAA